jgi:hypothetical protein
LFRFTIRDVFFLTTAIAWVAAFQLLSQCQEAVRDGGVAFLVSTENLAVMAVAYVLLAAGLFWHSRSTSR